MTRRTSLTARNLLVTASLLGAMLLTSATASPTVAEAGWNGRCYYPFFTDGAYRVWCDGTGPQSYQARAVCSNPSRTASDWYYGVKRWYGDVRGSRVTCPYLWSITYNDVVHEY